MREEDRRRDQERQEGVALVAIEARRHELVDLVGDDREGDEQRAEQRELHLREEIFLRRRVDQLDLAQRPGRLLVGDDQEVEDRRRRNRSRR